MGGRPPRRARRPDQRLDVPLGGARGPAAGLAQPDADDDELGRALPHAGRRGRARDRLARGRLAPACLHAGAPGGAQPPGRLGEDVRASARADLRGGRAGALPADGDRGGARRRLPAHGRLHRPQPADLRARRGRAPARGRDRHAHARDRDSGRARPSLRRRDGQGPGGGRGCGERGRNVRGRDREARRRERAGDPDGARVPDHEAERRPAGRADDARPLAARLLPRRVGRARHGRLRAPPGALGARRHPTRLQRAAPPRGLGAVRGAHDQRRRARPGARGGRGREARQRAGSVHAGRRVHPRRDRCPRLLGRGRLLRARSRRRRGDGAARGGVDRRRRPEPGRLGDGLAPVRLGLQEPRVHAHAHARGLLDLLRRQVSRPRAPGRAAAAPLADVRAPARAGCRLRREVGLGARELVRAERESRRRVPTPARLGRAPLVAGDRRRAPRLP